VGGIFRRRSFRGLFARYARHDIWRCTAANEPREFSVSNLAADSQIALLSMLFLGGVVFLLGSFGVSGWMRSRRVGIATTSLALIGAVAVFAALRPFLHVVSTPIITSNQSMQPTAPSQGNFSVLATTPCRGLSLSR